MLISCILLLFISIFKHKLSICVTPAHFLIFLAFKLHNAEEELKEKKQQLKETDGVEILKGDDVIGIFA